MNEQEKLEKLSNLSKQSSDLETPVRFIKEMLGTIGIFSSLMEDALFKADCYFAAIEAGISVEPLLVTEQEISEVKITPKHKDTPITGVQWAVEVTKARRHIENIEEQVKNIGSNADQAIEILTEIWSRMRSSSEIVTGLHEWVAEAAAEEPIVTPPEAVIKEIEEIIKPEPKEQKIEAKKPAVEEPEPPEPAEPVELVVTEFVCPECLTTFDNRKSLRGHCSATKHEFPKGV